MRWIFVRFTIILLLMTGVSIALGITLGARLNPGMTLTTLAYDQQNEQFTVLMIDTAHPLRHRLALPVEVNDLIGEISPDGRRILLYSGPAQQTTLFVWDIASGDVYRPPAAYNPCRTSQQNIGWMPDSDRVYFRCQPTIDNPDVNGLYLLEFSTRRTEALTTDDHIDRVQQSPDGQMLAYESEGRLIVVPFDDEPFEAYRTARNQVLFAWSPDGTRLVVAADDRLQIIPVDGSAGDEYLIGERFSNAPLWSPDGRWIAVEESPAGVVHLVDLTTGDERTLTGGEVKLEFIISLAWSPDSEGLIFDKSDRQSNQNGMYTIAPDDDDNAMTLTTEGSGVGLSFSSDGRYMTFTDGRSVRDWTLLVYESNIGETIAKIPAGDRITWLDDRSAFVYVQSLAPGNTIVLYDVTESKKMRLTDTMWTIRSYRIWSRDDD